MSLYQSGLLCMLKNCCHFKVQINEDNIAYNRDASNFTLSFKICSFVILYRSIWIHGISGMHSLEVVNYLFTLFYQ